MKFAYKVDGTVTGLNRVGQGEELTGTCMPQELVWGMVNEYYTADDGVLTPKTQAEVDAIKAQEAEALRISVQLRDLEVAKKAANDVPLLYAGKYFKTADGGKDDIQGTQNEALSQQAPEASINTFFDTENAGCWKVGNASGEIEYFSMTNSEFIDMAKALYLRTSKNFTIYDTTKAAIENGQEVDIDAIVWF